MPAIPSLCEEFEPCCPTWYTLAHQCSMTALEAVSVCLGPQCPTIDCFVSHSVPEGPGDYIAAWVSRVRPAKTTERTFIARIETTVSLVLVLDGYPMPEVVGGKPRYPAPVAMNRAAAVSHAAAEAMYRAVLSGVAAIGQKNACTSAAISDLRADAPQSGNVRWQFDVTFKHSL